RRQKPLGRPGTEQLSTFVESEDRGELPLVPQSARAQPARLAERRDMNQPRKLVARVGEVDELAARFDRRAFANRQMVERRVERRDIEPRVGNELALAEHPLSRVEPDEGDSREAIDLGERLAQRQQRGVRAGGY